MSKEKQEPSDPFAGFNILLSPVEQAKIAKDVEEKEKASKEAEKTITSKKPGEVENVIEEQEDLTEALEVEAKIKADKLALEAKKEGDKNITKDKSKDVVEELTDDKSKSNQDDFSWKPLVEHLTKKGIIDYDESSEEYKGLEFKNDDDLEKIIDTTVAKRTESVIKGYKESLPEDLHKLVEFVEAGGHPKDFLDVYYGSTSWEKIEPTDEQFQKTIVREGLRRSGYDEKEIEDEIKDYEDLGKLEAKAKVHLPKLRKQEEEQKKFLMEAQAQYAKAQREQVEKYWVDLKTDLDSKEDINGFKLTTKLKKDIWEHMSKPVDKKTMKTQLQINNETKKDAQFLYAMLDYLNWDISKLEKNVKTQVVSDLKAKLGNFSDNRSKQTRQGRTDNSSLHEDQDNAFKGFEAIKW